MNSEGKRAVEIAKRLIGTPYRIGGDAPGGFDPPGFVHYCYKKVGVSLPKSYPKLINMGKAVLQNELQVGDLVFTHSFYVGLYVGDNYFIHASNRGVIITVVPYFYTGRRVT